MIQTIHTNTYTTEASEKLNSYLGLFAYDGNCKLKEADDGENILVYNSEEFNSWQHDNEIKKVLEVIDDPILYALVAGQPLNNFEETEVEKLVGKPRNPVQIALAREKNKEIKEINVDFYEKMLTADLGEFDKLLKEHEQKLNLLVKKFRAIEEKTDA